MDHAKMIEAKLKELEAKHERERREAVESSLGPLREDLNTVRHQIAELRGKERDIENRLASLTGSAVKRGKTGRRSKRSPLSKEQKVERILQVFRSENVRDQFPLKAIVKRLIDEANLSPADLSPKNINGFMPSGFRIEGGGRNKVIRVN